MTNAMELDQYLMKQVEMGMDGADILHGHLKTLMYKAEHQLDLCIEEEERTGDTMDSITRAESAGYLEALSHVYQLTYAIAFAKQDIKNRKEVFGE